MRIPDNTIDHGTLSRLLEAGAPIAAEIIGTGGDWGVVIAYGRVRRTLAATRGRPRTFRRFETLAGYLKDLGIVEYRVDAADFEPAAAANSGEDKRSLVASRRMKRAHQAAAYDAWFRRQVQASIDEPVPSIDDGAARKKFAAKRAALAERAVGTKKARR